MTVKKLSLDKTTIFGIRDGFISLDGGAMFGVVPRVMWEKLMAPDHENRIKLGLNSLLVKTPDHLILIETGAGTGLKSRYYDYYSIEQKPGLVETIKETGFSVEDIDIVINTHLHFDHCGGNTRKNHNNEIVPVYRNAKYIIQKGEYKAAMNPTSRDRASYLKQNYEPIEKSGNLKLVEGNTTLCDGIEVILAEGHTAFHQCVKITAGGETIVFLGDMVPTSSHIGLPYIMSYDLFPLQTLQNKEKYYSKALEEDWILAFNHDPDYYFGRIEKSADKYRFTPLT